MPNTSSYDQWKTSSPWDNEIDWHDEYEVTCPFCGGAHMEGIIIDNRCHEDCGQVSFCCDDCGMQWRKWIAW